MNWKDHDNPAADPFTLKAPPKEFSVDDLLANIRTHVPEFDMATDIMRRVRAEGDANIKIVRLINLLGDIVACATNEPAKLTAFNSPLLQLACIEVYEHHNPDKAVDDREKQIFRQMAAVGYNV